jgi:hypothetical protein
LRNRDRTAIAAILVLFGLTHLGAQRTASPDCRVSYLKDGKLWTAKLDGREKLQEPASGRIENYLFSSDLKYLAYTKVLKYVDEPGIFDEDEEKPQSPVCSIVIMDLASRKNLREIRPQEDWIYIARWLPANKLLYYQSSGFDVGDFFRIDPVTGKQEKIDTEKTDQVWNGDYAIDGSWMLYVDDTGVGETYRMNLHLKDFVSNSDTVLVSRKSIYDPAHSKNRNQVAFLEVSEEGKKYQDTLWIFDVKSKQLSRYYTGPSRPKSAGDRCIAWSLDDKYVALFLAPEALIFASGDPRQSYKIPGSDFSWLPGKKIIYSKGNDLFLYDLTSLKSSLFMEQAERPRAFFRQ